MRGRPVEGGEDAGERPRKARHVVGNHGQPEIGEARRIAVGVDDQPVALRRQAFDDALEDGSAGEPPQRLVAAAHAPRQPAGEEHAEGGG